MIPGFVNTDIKMVVMGELFQHLIAESGLETGSPFVTVVYTYDAFYIFPHESQFVSDRFKISLFGIHGYRKKEKDRD
jgi:hypothetical protein